ncbi:MAG: hypothetical protein R3Y19_05890 [Rikenellaceae bacterium]
MITDRNDATHLEFNDQYGFKYREVTTCLNQDEQRSQINILTHNAIFFQLSGELHIFWESHNDLIIKPGDLYFLPRGANVSAYMVDKEMKYIVARLDHDLDNLSLFKELFKDEKYNNQEGYSFSSLPIKEPMKIFVDSIERYILDGIDNPQLHNMKFLELYMIFLNYYTRQECVNLFYPVFKEGSKFKTFIFE